MNKVLRYMLALVICACSGMSVYADDNDNEFEPIHATIAPGNGILKFEETSGKKASVFTNGDALIFSISRFKEANTWTTLPINAQQDYTLEFKFKIIKGDCLITIGSDMYTITFGKKIAAVDVSGGQGVFSKQKVQKWKTPEGEEKGVITCKIVKHRSIITFYLNDKYVSELNVKPDMSLYRIGISCLALKSSEVELQSVRIDQGPETDD